ncbi:Predicted kinase, aminoglycoside phosphotransferase (APT) family [Nocardioides scoriae]|uniref:Predicted kinase, aminoglycoside phosphotransferase (APT) family n=1 Tax=Nocardioides scoriae TaxID=642780 RepID=A0A1H1W3M1_9ACTN|nr:phosphotransferase family protein [Nocardioides scoriae]SDS91271.1 Predicted kinase, aminoglycoside phosphotransferase (APT) family [Nocardioides scoriae]
MSEQQSGIDGPIDGATPVREEDAFDLDAVRTWLAGQGTELGEDVEVQQFGGGASNLTYSLRDGRHDLILRRPPAGQKARGAHDMGREFRVQSGLAEVFPLVPRMLAHCTDESVIGAEFYVMERVDGVIPRRDFPPGVDLSPEQTRELCLHALDVLVDLHSVDVDDTELASMNKGDGYVERQVSGWSRRFRDARTEDVGDYEQVMGWLEAHRPGDVGHCLIHNDFRFDNLVLDREDPTRVVGVLDWEMATVGDPLMDLGGTLAYWVQADDDDFYLQFRRQPTTAPGMLTRQEVVDHYLERTGREVSAEQWRFYEVFGLFRLGVIAQQIYYRYFHGQTTNEAYAIFGPAARYLEQRCERIIAASDAPDAG